MSLIGNSMWNKGVDITELQILLRFDVYLVVNKWITAVIIWNLSRHYCPKTSALGVGIFGYTHVIKP